VSRPAVVPRPRRVRSELDRDRGPMKSRCDLRTIPQMAPLREPHGSGNADSLYKAAIHGLQKVS